MYFGSEPDGIFFATSLEMDYKYKVFSALLFLIVFIGLGWKIVQVPSPKNTSPAFSVGINQKIRKAFLDVWKEYKELHSYGFDVIQNTLSSSTMQAQPVIELSDIFGKNRRYKIDVAEKVLDSDDLLLSDLPDKVLRGWFAHELGHIVDYENHSNIGMVTYGIRYVLSDKFKREREHEADSIAIRHGFRSDVIAAKKFILENDFISPDYQNQIKKYYMSIRGAELCPDERIPVLPKVEI